MDQRTRAGTEVAFAVRSLGSDTNATGLRNSPARLQTCTYGQFPPPSALTTASGHRPKGTTLSERPGSHLWKVTSVIYCFALYLLLISVVENRACSVKGQ